MGGLLGDVVTMAAVSATALGALRRRGIVTVHLHKASGAKSRNKRSFASQYASIEEW